MSEIRLITIPKFAKFLFALAVLPFALYGALSAINTSLSDKLIELHRNEIDGYFEFLLASNADIGNAIRNIYSDNNVVAACFGGIAGLNLFLSPNNIDLLQSDTYFDRYSTSDQLWRMVLVRKNNLYQILYLKHYFEPTNPDRERDCYQLEGLKIRVESPGVDNGSPKSGVIEIVEGGRS